MAKRDRSDDMPRCTECGTRFVFDPSKHTTRPTNCGALSCSPVGDVHGKARMAAARKQAGVPLTRADRVALKAVKP